MNPIAFQQATLDNSLFAPEKRLKIKRCNARIAFTKPQKEETYQVTLEALKLSPCYPAFQISAEVPKIYMHQFWNTVNKIGNTDAYNFKIDKKKCRVDTKVFREILQIYPRLPNQEFDDLPSEDDLVSFIKELGYSGNCEMLFAIRTDQMHQPWRTFAVVINRLMYQADKRETSSARKEHMPYPRFTKVPSSLFLKQKIINGALIPDGMINDDIKLSTTYKTYLDYATGKVPPEKARKFKKLASSKLKTVPASPKESTQKGKRVKRPTKKATTAPTIGVVIRDTPGKSVSKKKAPDKADRGKGIELLSDDALLEDA
ncbi:hypothetical protein Tco_1437016 [Tanacetum coccineum]